MKNSKVKKLCIIKGASHLFEKEESILEAAELATDCLTSNFNMHIRSNGINR